MDQQPLTQESLIGEPLQAVPLGIQTGDVIRITNLQWSTPAPGQMDVMFNIVGVGGQPLTADILTLSWGYDTSYSETPVVQNSASTFATTLSVTTTEDVTVYLRADASAAIGNAASRLATAWTLDQTVPGITGYTWIWSRAASGAPGLADLQVEVAIDGTKGNSLCEGAISWIGGSRTSTSAEAYGANPHILTFVDLPGQTQMDLDATVFDRSGNTFNDITQQQVSPNYSPPQVLSHTVDVAGTSITYNIEVDKSCNVTIRETPAGGALEDQATYPVLAGAIRQIPESVLQQSTVYNYTLTPTHPQDGAGTQVGGSFTSGVGALNWVSLPVYAVHKVGDGYSDLILVSAEVDNPPDEDWTWGQTGGSQTPIAGSSGQTRLENVVLISGEDATEDNVGENWDARLIATVTGSPLVNVQQVAKQDQKLPVTPIAPIWSFSQTGSAIGNVTLATHTWDELTTLRTKVTGGQSFITRNTVQTASGGLANSVRTGVKPGLASSPTCTIVFHGASASSGAQWIINFGEAGFGITGELLRWNTSSATGRMIFIFGENTSGANSLRVETGQRVFNVNEPVQVVFSVNTQTRVARCMINGQLYDCTLIPTGNPFDILYASPEWRLFDRIGGTGTAELTNISYLGINQSFENLDNLTVSRKFWDIDNGGARNPGAQGIGFFSTPATFWVEGTQDDWRAGRANNQDGFFETVNNALSYANTADDQVVNSVAGTWLSAGSNTTFPAINGATNILCDGANQIWAEYEGTDVAGNRYHDSTPLTSPDYGPPVISDVLVDVNQLNVTIDLTVDKDCDVLYSWAPNGGAIEDTRSQACTTGANQIQFQALIEDQLYDYSLIPSAPVYGVGPTEVGQFTTEPAAIAWVTTPTWQLQYQANALARLRISGSVTAAPDQDWEYNLDGGGWTAIAGTSGLTALSDQIVLSSLTATEAQVGEQYDLQTRVTLGADAIVSTYLLDKEDFKAPVPTPDPVPVDYEPAVEPGAAEIFTEAHTWDEPVLFESRLANISRGWINWGTNTSFGKSVITDGLQTDGVTIYNVQIRATDAAGNVTFQQTPVQPPNYGQPITNIAPVWVTFSLAGQATEGQTFTEDFTGYADDPDVGQIITYSVVQADGTDATFVGNVLTINTPGAAGVRNLIIRATDDGTPQLFTDAAFTLTVNVSQTALAKIRNDASGGIATFANTNPPTVPTTRGFTLAFYGSTPTLGPVYRRAILFEGGDGISAGNWDTRIFWEWGTGVDAGKIIAWVSNAGRSDNMECMPTTFRMSTNTVYQIVCSFDTDNQIAHIMVDGTNLPLDEFNSGNPFDVSWDRGEWHIFKRHNQLGEDNPVQDVAYLMASNTYHDLSQQAVRDQFWDSVLGRSKDPGIDGSNFFGQTANLYILGDAADWSAGRGNGVDGFFDVINEPTNIADDGTVEVTP